MITLQTNRQMLRLLFMFLLACTVCLRGQQSIQAQQLGDGPLVVFVSDARLRTRQVEDLGFDGVSRLAQMCVQMGARVQSVNLDAPIPEEAKVVILVGPQTRLAGDQLGRLWAHLEHGNHLLLALDPLLFPDSAGHPAGGLARLLGNDYGIGLLDTFLMEPWFSVDTISDVDTSYLFSYGSDSVDHLISNPLHIYEVPVQLWGARNILVASLGPGYVAMPFLYTHSPYAESRYADIIRETIPLEFNEGEDMVGKFVVGAIAENYAMGSRLVVFGDSELLQNGYGLAIRSGAGEPLNPGNWMLLERTMAWLLDIPVDDWPDPPFSESWLAVDGGAQGWEQDRAAIIVDDNDMNRGSYDLRQVRTLSNIDYMYFLAETVEPAQAETLITLSVDFNLDGTAEATVFAKVDGVQVTDQDGIETVVPDARLVAGEALELRLPLRIIQGDNIRILDFCIGDLEAEQPVDCLAEPFFVPELGIEEPLLRHPDDMRVTIRVVTSRVNLYFGPSLAWPEVGTVWNGQVLAAVGQDATGEWVYVQSARSTGWIRMDLVIGNGDLGELPVVD